MGDSHPGELERDEGRPECLCLRQLDCIKLKIVLVLQQRNMYIHVRED